MSNKRWGAKRDIAEPDIVKALEKVGCLVYRALPSDLLVYRDKYGAGMFKVLEVKSDPYADKRQEEQRKFLLVTGTPIVRSIEDAIREVGL